MNQFESIKGGGNDFQMAILIDGDVILIGIQLPFLPVNFQVGAGQVLRWHGAGGSEKFQLKHGVLPSWKIGRFEYMDYLGGTFKWLAYAKFFHGPMDDQKNQGTPDFGNIWWSIPFSWLNFQGWRFHQHRGNQTWFHDEKQSTRKGIWVILSIPCRYSKFFFSTMMWLGFLAIVYDPNWPQFLRGFKPASHWNWVLSWFQKRLRIPHSFSTVRPLLQIDWEWVWVYWVPWRNHIVVYCNRHFLPHLMDIVNVSGKPGASTIYLR